MNSTITLIQTSSGGVAYRIQNDRIEVALISVGENNRWQLPKGMVGKGESNETAALREVREETGLVTELIAPLDKIEYWYSSKGNKNRVRFHKFVYFYLLRYLSGNPEDHDDEVNEARWIEIKQAIEMLSFKTEKDIVAKALEFIRESSQESDMS